ncbi:ribosome maturation factor RimM [Actinopolyspora mortivallis]|uniref:Ribosome maturation factor RimM n=1 Tax=Actinopolyspora mortivallis TaxID=33906 RepID=A0A2T0GTW4_ACTMO|nr:ribosome maturation factor RimM [Actinopolyspora mortivallis]PRW62537.1 ribosome maturation factor RimM [Actinopolyspora mortivallis]
MAEQQAAPLVVGRVVKPHGVRGEFMVDVRSDSPDRRFVAGAVLGVGGRTGDAVPESLELVAARWHAGRLLVRAREVSTREGAERLRGALLTVRPEELERPEDPDEFHDHQLEGLSVEHTDGTVVGTVAGVVHTPAGELLRVSVSGERRESLVPFVHDIVVEVDLAAGTVLIDPPEGLLDPF